jgi:hypothetical protein
VAVAVVAAGFICSREAAVLSRGAAVATLPLVGRSWRPRKPSVEATWRRPGVGVGMAEDRGCGRRDVGLGRPLVFWLAEVVVLRRLPSMLSCEQRGLSSWSLGFLRADQRRRPREDKLEACTGLYKQAGKFVGAGDDQDGGGCDDKYDRRGLRTELADASERSWRGAFITFSLKGGVKLKKTCGDGNAGARNAISRSS